MSVACQRSHAGLSHLACPRRAEKPVVWHARQNCECNQARDWLRSVCQWTCLICLTYIDRNAIIAWVGRKCIWIGLLSRSRAVDRHMRAAVRIDKGYQSGALTPRLLSMGDDRLADSGRMSTWHQMYSDDYVCHVCHVRVAYSTCWHTGGSRGICRCQMAFGHSRLDGGCMICNLATAWLHKCRCCSDRSVDMCGCRMASVGETRRSKYNCSCLAHLLVWIG